MYFNNVAEVVSFCHILNNFIHTEYRRLVTTRKMVLNVTVGKTESAEGESERDR